MNFRRLVPFHSPGGVAKNLIGEHIIFGPFFENGQLKFCYGASHWGVARDRYGEIGLWNVGIIHAFQWDWHLGW